jgi:hypothetical protein
MVHGDFRLTSEKYFLRFGESFFFLIAYCIGGIASNAELIAPINSVALY